MKLSQLPDMYCLGVEALGQCYFNLANPSLTIFSIGQLATVVALAFTFSQLARPIHKFRLATRIVPQRAIWIVFGCGIVAVFAAAILRAWPNLRVPIASYPIFWEFVAGICIILSGLITTYRVSSKATFSKRNAIRFLKESQSLLARGSTEDLREYGEEIEKSIELVISGCRQAERRQFQERISGKKLAASDYPTFERVCCSLVDLWSDRQFCQLLVTRCPLVAIRIVDQIQKMRVFEFSTYHLIEEIVAAAMSNPDSMLHREGAYSGFGRNKPFTSTVFGNVDFVVSRLRPLQAWHPRLDNGVRRAHVERYGDALKIAIDAAIAAGRYQDFYAAFSSALEVVNGLSRDAAIALTRISEQEASRSEAFWVLFECGEIAVDAIERFCAIPSELLVQPGETFDPDNYISLNDQTIFRPLASCAFEYLESLAICKGHDDMTRTSALRLWAAIFPWAVQHPENTGVLIAIRQRFLFFVRSKVEQNLNVEHWFYPVITRVLIAMWGIPNSENTVQALPDNYEREESDFYVFFFTLLKNNYLQIRRKDENYAKELLPQSVDFVPPTQSLRQTRFRGQATSFRLL